MTCASVPVGSREFFFVGLRHDSHLGHTATTDDDPVIQSVHTALVRGARAAPAPDAWTPASYDGREIRGLLTGTEPAGRWTVWVRVDAAPEAVVRRAGVLSIG